MAEYHIEVLRNGEWNDAELGTYDSEALANYDMRWLYQFDKKSGPDATVRVVAGTGKPRRL